MLKKKRSFISYIIGITGLIILAGVVSLLIMQKSLIQSEIEHRANDRLFREIRRVKSYIRFDKAGVPYIKDNYYDKAFSEDETMDCEIYVFTRDIEGAFYDGSVPKGYNNSLQGAVKDFKVVRIGEREYYAASRKAIPKKDKASDITDASYMISTMVAMSDIKTEYRGLWIRSCVVILVVGVLLFVFAIVLKRRLLVPVKELEESIKSNCENLNFTEKLNYDGPFIELELLIDANNALNDRILKELDRQKEFNANVSHELRTPIAVMHAQCQLSREIAEKTGDENMLESIEVFEKQTTRMKGLIEQVLRMSMLDSKKHTFSDEDVDLLDVIESVCEDMEYVCDKDIRFSYDLKSTVIRANMNLIVIVVSNLVSNAIKYSNPGKTVSISCGKEKGYYYIRVKDEGCGIEKNKQSKIFDSYYRDSDNRNLEGYGLGLPQVMKISQYYGGTVKVDSLPGRGSTFTALFAEEKVRRTEKNQEKNQGKNRNS